MEGEKPSSNILFERKKVEEPKAQPEDGAGKLKMSKKDK